MRNNFKTIDSDSWVACLTYKSRLNVSLAPDDLLALAKRARSRNRNLGITGMLVYDEGRFLQTIEGSVEKLDALWSLIQRDLQYSEIEILSEHIAPARAFSDWDILLDSRLGHAPVSEMSFRSAPADVARHINSLVDFALNANDLAANALVVLLAEQGWTSNAIVRLLIEPTAHALGDAWLAGSCSELDLTIGISMLQLAGHAARLGPSADTSKERRYSILLSTAPGERHKLGTALLADQFTDAGWKVDVAFPSSDQALANQISAERPDAMHVGLSDAVIRQDALARLRSTLDLSRLAAPDEPMVISVGGRLFAEASATAQSVGADHARVSASGANIQIFDLVKQNRARKAMLAQVSPQPDHATN